MLHIPYAIRQTESIMHMKTESTIIISNSTELEFGGIDGAIIGVPV